jgi:endonuclease YncB( thermonuclease family)
MQFLLASFVAAVAAVSPSWGLTRSNPVLVQTVVDGDTIDVSTFGRVRLLGIDAPELGRMFDTSAPFAKEARDRLASLVLHRWIRLEQEGPALDVYNRHLAYVVTEDGVCANVVLVHDGLARVSARMGLTRLAELKRAEADAQAFRRGIWGATPQIPTTGYTRRSGSDRSAGTARVPANSVKKPRPKPAKAKPAKAKPATAKPKRPKKSRGV